MYLQLEKLRNENLSSLLPLEDHNLDPSIQRLQREVSHLDMVRLFLFPNIKKKKNPAVHIIEQILSNSSWSGK